MSPNFPISKEEDSKAMPLKEIKENVSYLIQHRSLKVLFGLLVFFEEIQ